MIRILSYFIVNIIVLILLDNLLSNFGISNIWAATGFVIVLTILNWTIIPLIKLLTLPITILTFGLFSLLINMLSILVTAQIVNGVSLNGSWIAQLTTAFLICVCLSLAQSIVRHTTDKKSRDE